MTEPAKLDRDAWYDEHALHRLGFSTGSLAKARRAGELRYRNAGRNGRAIYRGSWVEAWLSGDASECRELAGVAG